MKSVLKDWAIRSFALAWLFEVLIGVNQGVTKFAQSTPATWPVVVAMGVAALSVWADHREEVPK